MNTLGDVKLPYKDLRLPLQLTTNTAFSIENIHAASAFEC